MKIERIRNSCQTGKIGYKTRVEAQSVIKSSVKRHHANHMQAYNCKFCGMIHLTNHCSKYGRKKSK